MPSTLPRLLVIDDSKSFLEHLNYELKDYFDLYLHYSQARKEELENVLEFTFSAKPEHLLLDVNLYKSGISQMILEQATQEEKLPSDCKVWMISQAEKNEREVLSIFQALNPNVQNKLLHKPISAINLSAELLDQSLFNPEESLWKSLPLPLRVLTQQGKVAYHNSYWKKGYYPDPAEKVDLWKKKGEVPENKEYAGSFGDQSAGFTLHCFELEQNGQKYLGQVAERHPVNTIPSNLDATVKAIFAAMQRAGFSRGRFYRLETLAEHIKSEQYQQTLELQELSYPCPENLTLPYRIPCTGEIKKRLAEYSKKLPASNNNLLYKIRTCKDDVQAEDEAINELNTLLGLDELKSWLEVPVWFDDPENKFKDTNASKHIMAALLIFDRMEVDNSSSLKRVLIDNIVAEESVELIKPLLVSLVDILKRAFEQEFYQNLLSYECQMRSLDRELVKLSEEQRYQKVLKTLCDLSGACSGIMVIKKHSEYLSVVASYGLTLPKAIKAMQFSLSATCHPIVAAWKSGQPKVFQNFSNSDEKKDLKENFDQNSHYKQSITEYEKDEFLRWLDDFKGNLAIPVQVGTNKTIGGITLQFNEAEKITVRIVQQIEAVLHRARWIIQQANEERNARFEYWQQVLGHDMKTSLYIVDQNIYELERMLPDLKNKREWLKTRRYLGDAHDMAENWMDMMSDTLEQLNEQFIPKISLEDYIELSQLRLNDEQINLSFKPSLEDMIWQSTLSGNEAIFGRTIRVLLDNAFKFGRYAIPEGKDIVINIEAQLDSGANQLSYWVLSIRNPGLMSEAAKQLCFIAGKIPEDSTSPGAHVGLSVTKRWVESFGGTLSLQNETNSHSVVATLKWPIYTNKRI